VPVINLKNSRKKTILQVFFVVFTKPASPLGVYGTPLLPANAANKNSKRETLFTGIDVYSHGIAGFTDQRTAFTCAQSAILQSQDFIWCVQHTLEIPYPRS